LVEGSGHAVCPFCVFQRNFVAITQSFNSAQVCAAGRRIAGDKRRYGSGGLEYSSEPGDVKSGAHRNTAALCDPVANTWAAAGSLAASRLQHSATLLPSGKLLAAAGTGSSHVSINSAALYLEDFGINDARRPVIATATNPVALGGSITVSGTGLLGVSEAASGSSNSSATNYLLLQLRRVDNGQVTWTAPASGNTRSATAYQSAALPSLPKGQYVLTVFVNGIASASTVINMGVGGQTISFGPAPTIVFGGTGTVTGISTGVAPSRQTRPATPPTTRRARRSASGSTRRPSFAICA